MTDTAKPTPGPWRCRLDGTDFAIFGHEAELIGIVFKRRCENPIDGALLPFSSSVNGELIAEAGTVFHETNLTPRQLLERVRELEAALAGAEKELSVWHESAERGELAWYDAQERGDLPFFGLKKIRAALTKHGEESQ